LLLTSFCCAALALAALRQRAARLAVAGASTLQAASGGPGAALKFEGLAWNSSTVSQIAMAKAHTEMVLLQVGVRQISHVGCSVWLVSRQLKNSNNASV
jgi:hypothetical protein